MQGRGSRLGFTYHNASHIPQESLTPQAALQPSLPVSIICFSLFKRKGAASAQNPPKNLKEKYQHEEPTHSLIKSVAYLALSSGFSTKDPGHCQEPLSSLHGWFTTWETFAFDGLALKRALPLSFRTVCCFHRKAHDTGHVVQLNKCLLAFLNMLPVEILKVEWYTSSYELTQDLTSGVGAGAAT